MCVCALAKFNLNGGGLDDLSRSRNGHGVCIFGTRNRRRLKPVREGTTITYRYTMHAGRDGVI